MPATQSAPTIRLSDYEAPHFWIDAVTLSFDLHPSKTRVTARIDFRPNTDIADRKFTLLGEELTLISAHIDGQECAPTLTETGLSADAPDVPFTWEATVEINPEANTSLNGLYMSNGMYCTQCEAEGFRKITYFPDRPDVMGTYTVRIKAGDAALPVLLSNGNDLGPDADGYYVWHDPHPKPSYLFALVAGDLVAHSDQFKTASGRDVALNIWVRPGDEGKCAYAMDALKRSMAWDEEVYGREYDLDLFNIVAVDDFNMGAMENKGLNIFNSKYVLASPETATDRDYELIEGIIAHEYFHNWTGNRITCRDWFQLCLKEGLTVFRDQQFSGDMRSEPVKRIDDVLMLRGRQFREDAGPLAHPVRPEEYIEINNFYTATVYEKGAEVIRMLKILVGDDTYDAALSEYFTRHDGQACTIEDWLAVFEDISGRDLSQFKRWYSQAGTPEVTVTCKPTGILEIDDQGRQVSDKWRLSFTQETQPTPGQDAKEPLLMPIKMDFYGPDGAPLMADAVAKRVFEFKDTRWAEDIFTNQRIPRPIVSAFQGFSAPVIVKQDLTQAERLTLFAHDRDPFNRWEAGNQLAIDAVLDHVASGAPYAPALIDAYRATALDRDLDPAYRALILAVPSEDTLGAETATRGMVVDPDAIHAARGALLDALAGAMADDLGPLVQEMAIAGPYAPRAEDAGKRALKAKAVALLARIEPAAETAKAQFEAADNMTESLSALATLIRAGAGAAAVQSFYDRWQADRLVIDKWFAVQMQAAAPDAALDAAKALATHPDFTLKNPNRFRSLIAPFAMNQAGFHRADGQGYAFLADQLIALDPINPQTTARMCGLFETWTRFDAGRKAHAKRALQRILDLEGLSKDSAEILGKIVAAENKT